MFESERESEPHENWLLLKVVLEMACYNSVLWFVFVCEQVEQSLLRSTFAALARQMNRLFWSKLWYVMLEQFFMKYMWGLSGRWGVATELSMPSVQPFQL